MVLSILSDTTRPSLTLRDPRCRIVTWSVSVIGAFLSGRGGASRRAGRLAGCLVARSLHVLGCLLARRFDAAVRNGRLDRLLVHRRGLCLLPPGNHGQAACMHDGQDPRDVLADLPDLPVVVQLTDGELEAELVQLPTRSLEPAVQLFGVQRL